LCRTLCRTPIRVKCRLAPACAPKRGLSQTLTQAGRWAVPTQISCFVHCRQTETDRQQPVLLAYGVTARRPRPDIRGTRRKVAAAVPAAAPGVEEGGARRLTGLFSHALPGTAEIPDDGCAGPDPAANPALLPDHGPGFTHQTALIAKPARRTRALVWKRALTSAPMKL